MKKTIFLEDQGQALITLLVFALVAITVASAAIIILYVNTVSVSKFQSGISVYAISESGLENGLLRLIRDPQYLGETITVGSGSATITVNGSNPWTVTSVGRLGNFARTVSVVASESGGVYYFSSWKEE